MQAAQMNQKKSKIKMYFVLKLLSILSIFFAHEIQAKTRIGIVSDYNYCGEREVGWRIKKAAKSLGWDAFLDEYNGRYLKKIENLDFVICLIPNNKFLHPDCPNYTTIFHPFNYLEPNGNLRSFYNRYDGYLMTIVPSKQLQNSIGNKKLICPFFPTIQDIPYKKVPLNNLMTMIAVWSNRFSDEKFQNLYGLLSQSGFTKFYGLNHHESLISSGYMGKIPFDGQSVIDILQQNGIILILHSDVHNREKIPSSRIFEAAAASAVIISDENEFIKNHFGDSVFYIDTSRSSIEIFNQIKSYMDLIIQKPEEAWEKARKAHEIFEEKFRMTDQLLKLESLNRKAKKAKTRQKK